jgi:ribose-phosphate pyrophosphokinase
MKSVVIAMPGNEALADALAAELSLERVAATVRHFPDGESHVRVEAEVEGRDALIACTLDRPDDKLVPLLLLAAAVREAGARSVGLVAPYLAYMRQDRRFQHSETISAAHVAAWISRHVDWLVTVDPHLHRIADLSQVYSIPSRVVHAADGVAA